jgi:uncharacterized protein (DUF697 family)/predicted GTPase
MSVPDDDEPIRRHISDLLKQIEQMDVLDNLNIPFVDTVQSEIGQLRRMLADQRPARLALVGRRGSGKSSLINAIFGDYIAEVGHETAMTGQATWWSYEGERGIIDVLDTRGLQEGSTPQQQDSASHARASIKQALEEKPADVMVFLVKASEVDSAIDADIDALVELSDWLNDAYGHRPPIVGVVTHCDTVEPKNVELHDPDDFPAQDVQEKRERVRRIVANLKGKLRDRAALADHLMGPIGVSSYMSWRDDGSIRADERWHIEKLTDYLVDEIPDQAKFQLARLAQVRFVQRKVANRLVQAVSVVCGALGAAPLPVADIAPITGLQVSMIVGIGYLSGRNLDMEAATEFIAAMGVNAGAAFGFREAARALVQFVPLAGNAVSAAIAYGATYALGKAAIAYFIGDADEEEARDIFERQKSEAKQEFDEESLE